jgi:phage terminase small subunit
MSGEDLTPKQRMFCLAYLGEARFNGTQAAIAAGYSRKTAAKIASENLRKPEICEFLRQTMDKLQADQEDSAKRTVAELERLGHYDIGEAFDELGRLKPIHEIPEALRRCIIGMEVVEYFEPVEDPESGKVRRQQVGVLKKVKWAPKVEALALLGKKDRIFAERVEHVSVPAQDITPEEWEALARLEHEVRGKSRDA